MEFPETQYAATSEGAVAYQVVGDGALDLVFVPDWATNIEVMWEEPRIERFFRRLGSFSRVLVFDKRGTGVSDPVPLGALPTIEQWTDDIRAVMDAAGFDRAAIFGYGPGNFLAMPFAAAHPERTHALVVAEGLASLVRKEDYPAGLPPESVEMSSRWMVDHVRPGGGMEVFASSLIGDRTFLRWFRRYLRLSISPEAFDRFNRWAFGIDIRDVVPNIRVPTLILHRSGDRYVRVGHGRWLAEHLSGAKYVELDGDDHLYFAGDQDAMLSEVQTFLTGMRGTPEVDRVLASVLFTDIVASTERAAELGDRRWREVLDAHESVSRREVESFRGRLVKTTGDGVLATFDGPARAIRCARAIGDRIRGLGLEIRAGLHTGEVELRGEDVGGIAVNLAARVMGKAGPGETIVSSTVKDLVVGSGIEFDDRGEHELKGVPGAWRLFVVRS